MDVPPRTLWLPAAGRPRWVCPQQMPLDLLYLSWGLRRFGESPSPVLRHHGWVYAFVRRGHPILKTPTGQHRLDPGLFAVIDPDCASGWIDEPKGASELLLWMWRSAPRSEDCTPEPGGYRLFDAASARRKLECAHLSCRVQVEHPDALTKLELEQVRLQVDLALARAQRPGATPPEPALRIEFARRWLLQNLSTHRPVAALCQYLRVSPTTLNRLFREHFRESASAYHQRQKTAQAQEWLESGGMSVKAVAYALGYRHPNDFSRAFKERAGRAPQDITTVVKGKRPRPSSS